jgi:hypothetical protein
MDQGSSNQNGVTPHTSMLCLMSMFVFCLPISYSDLQESLGEGNVNLGMDDELTIPHRHQQQRG